MLDLPEELVPWRLLAADLLVGILIAVAVYLVAGRLAARQLPKVLPGGRIGRLVSALAFAGLIVLAGRRFYGPPFRFALTAPVDRPAQRFADQVAESPEIRAWYARRTAELRASGEPEDMLPRTLSYERSELRRNGFARLDGVQLMLRTQLLARAFSHVGGSWTCASIIGGGERDIGRLLSGFDRAEGQAWFQLLFAAMVAEAKGAPPAPRVADDEKRRMVAELAAGRGGPGPRQRSSHHPPTESGGGAMLDRCDRERDLYRQVSGWDGPRRALADRVLATADSYLTGKFEDDGVDQVKPDR